MELKEVKAKPIGIVASGARPDAFRIFTSQPLRVGEYVKFDTDDGKAMAFIENTVIGSTLIEESKNFYDANEAASAAANNPRDKSYISEARTVGLLEMLKKGKVEFPSIPPVPGTPVELVSREELQEIFNRSADNYVRVGSLLRKQEISVSVNIDKVASRHLAVLAATGGGKSNLLALLARRISELNGTMIIFDYHSEYKDLKIDGKNLVEPKLNPYYLLPDEVADIIGVRSYADVQRSLLSKAIRNLLNGKDSDRASGWDAKNMAVPTDFFTSLKSELERMQESEDLNHQQRIAVQRLISIIEYSRRYVEALFDTGVQNVLDLLEPNKINVVDLGDLNELQARIIIKFYLDEIFFDRKAAVLRNEEARVRFTSPVIVAIEEAHVFLPAEEKSDLVDTVTRIAREGRKFGVGLIIVSQRPSRLNSNVLSQMGSFAIMRITNSADKNYIKEVNEYLTPDMVENLSVLNPGEALLLGDWVTIPVMSKIELVGDKLIGKDIEAVSQWRRQKELSQEAPRTRDFL
ncbi:MAG: ATP-binding protein [Nitrososphaeria archaeon]